ncbi:unnamed protein product [Zymoseptoria tritici ST99CH_3D7]|uniref:Histidine kinase n=1 Tax=Zymoseptoria tritici (strain ST99CH_3D7) TaxID=1276538 RepID=A0A1X7REH9_ZYMT9|nr:unnamed protein product [Zymoseptoria tritici ST99CH_3D7]
MILPRRRTDSLQAVSFDWTNKGNTTATDFQKSVRENIDWTSSPLGAIEAWPATFRTMVLMAMADTTPSAVLYGTAIGASIVYNEAFAVLLPSKTHPGLQGHLVQEKLDDICSEFDAAWERQVKSGQVEILPDQRIRSDRLGLVEEKTYTWKLLPFFGEDGAVAGSLVTVNEDKSSARSERSKTVREIGSVMKGAIDRTANQTAVNILRLNQHFSGNTCNCARLWEVEEQLEAYKARYENFANYAPVGIAIVTREYSIEWANKAYHDVMEQTSDTTSFLDCVHPDDVSAVEGQFEHGTLHEGAYSFQCRLKKMASSAAVSPGEEVPQSSPAWILVSAYKGLDVDNNTTMCWIIDITAHKTAEEFLRRRMDEAMEMKKAKERFIDQTSHEVRNPLSAMIHCTEDIITELRKRGDASLSEALEAAQTISHCTQHIKNIVDDVLILSKLDSDLIQVYPKPTLPRQAIETAVKIFKGELRASSVDLTVEEDTSMEHFGVEWLLLDSNRALQVLFNLITNAIKVVKGRDRRRIVVRLMAAHRPEPPICKVRYVLPRQESKAVDFGPDANAQESVYLVLAVEDTGPGLTSDELSSLFERFTQAVPKTESRYGGSGLGLFISRDLTELQGGRLGIASEDGVGSTFLFSVECRKTEPPQDLIDTVKFDHPPTPQRSDTSHSFLRGLSDLQLNGQAVTRTQLDCAEPELEARVTRRVLVVEDNAINQKILANQLRKRSFEVKVASHGEEALSALQMAVERPVPPTINRKPVPGTLFDVVLMDIEMPVMDGITCVKRIRAYETSRGIPTRLPVIAVTANARSEHGTSAIEAGMDSVTTKPYKIEELVEEIEKVCTPPG